jgi:hypothetical protein
MGRSYDAAGPIFRAFSARRLGLPVPRPRKLSLGYSSVSASPLSSRWSAPYQRLLLECSSTRVLEFLPLALTLALALALIPPPDS